MPIRLLLALVLCLPAFGAVTAATIYEMRSAGTATSGGGFDSTIASAGTDLSIYDAKNAAACTPGSSTTSGACQSATVNISTADAVTNNSTTVTSATANFSSALIGNTIYLAGGGTTTGWYQVTAVGSATSITVDRVTGGAGGSSQTMNIGGAIGAATGFAQLEIASPNGIQPGNTAYVKAGGWTSIATQTFSIAGSAALPIAYIGYTTTRTDGGKATTNSGTATTVNHFAITGAFRKFYNFTVSQTSGATVKGFVITADMCALRNISSTGLTSAVIEFGATSYNAIVTDLYATGNGSSPITTTSNGSAGNGALLSGLQLISNTGAGITFAAAAGGNGTRFTVINSIIANNTGDGIAVTGTNPFTLLNSTIAGNGGDGLDVSAASNAAMVLRNNLFINNTAYGYRSTTDYSNSQMQFDYNGFTGNGTAKSLNLPLGPHDRHDASTPALTVSPITSSTNWVLNTDPNGGAIVRGAGFPGAFTAGSGMTGYRSLGALEPQVTAGGGQRGYTFIARAALHPQITDWSIQWPITFWPTAGALALMGAVIVWRSKR